MVERIEGCFHMKCPCKTHFCYSCATKLTTNGRFELHGIPQKVHFPHGIFASCINGFKPSFEVPTDVQVDVKPIIPTSINHRHYHRPARRLQHEEYPLLWRLNIVLAWWQCPALAVLMHGLVTRDRIHLSTILAVIITIVLMNGIYENLLPKLFTLVFMFITPWPIM